MVDTLPPLPEPIDLKQGPMTLPQAAAKHLRRMQLVIWGGACLWPLVFVIGLYHLSSPDTPSLVRVFNGLGVIVGTLIFCRWFLPGAQHFFGLLDAAQHAKPFLYREQESLRLVEAFRVHRSIEAYNALQAEYVAARAEIQAGNRPPFFDESRLRMGLIELHVACLDAHIKLLRACLAPAPLPSRPHVLPALPKRVTLAAFEARVCDLN